MAPSQFVHFLISMLFSLKPSDVKGFSDNNRKKYWTKYALKNQKINQKKCKASLDFQ
jgi:hypothetical protein